MINTHSEAGVNLEALYRPLQDTWSKPARLFRLCVSPRKILALLYTVMMMMMMQKHLKKKKKQLKTSHEPQVVFLSPLYIVCQSKDENRHGSRVVFMFNQKNLQNKANSREGTQDRVVNYSMSSDGKGASIHLDIQIQTVIAHPGRSWGSFPS